MVRVEKWTLLQEESLRVTSCNLYRPERCLPLRPSKKQSDEQLCKMAHQQNQNGHRQSLSFNSWLQQDVAPPTSRSDMCNGYH
ncbi:hypothetical protein HYE67_010075 [Fusarium culmorum]|uniref:Uncharacterized protein n=1 Tax=Fusarium culmorum TaxID=5516 RepID=A0A7S8DFW4_FUSCU|nr:hypothetical protein HYE67_010075 [Fusarium culmorum]